MRRYITFVTVPLMAAAAGAVFLGFFFDLFTAMLGAPTDGVAIVPGAVVGLLYGIVVAVRGFREDAPDREAPAPPR